MVLALPISVLGQNFADAYAEASIKKARANHPTALDDADALIRHAYVWETLACVFWVIRVSYGWIRDDIHALDMVMNGT